MSGKAKTHKKRGKPFYKRIFSKVVVTLVNQINFEKLVSRAAAFKSGKRFFELYNDLPEDWQNAAKIRELAVDLTLDQLVREGEKTDRESIEKLVDEIAIRYSRKIHQDCACAVGRLFDQLFDHQNPDLPFTSPDGRDLKYLEQLKAYREQGLGVVYLVNHSSHLDEFLFDLLWQNLNMGLPVFAAGQNMMAIKSIEKLLMTGSYVVVRQGASRHQVAALYNYCSAVSRLGAQQGIFLEAWRGGARTRDGSLRYPKRLVTLKGAINVVDDVVIQPVAISYSIVPEDLMMCSRKSARSWVRGMGFFRTLAKIPLNPISFLWKSAKNLYGRAYITVPPPLLLSELKKAHEKDKTGISIDEFVALASIKEIARNKKIMASQITARGLVQAKKKETADLLSAVQFEMEAIREYHRNTFGEEPDFEDFVRNNTMGDIVADGLKTLKQRGVLKRFGKDPYGLPQVKDEIALSYYATHADRRLYSPTADQNIVVVGAGNWGFALATHIGNRLLEDKKYNNASLTIFDSRPDVVEHMGLNRQGTGRFSDKVLPKNIFVTSDYFSAFRKASEVLIATKPEDFETRVREILEISEQPLKIIIGTRGFVPGMNCLPHTAVRRLINEYERRDVDILTIAGPVDPEDLIESEQVKGILAGPATVIKALVDIFARNTVEAFLSTDPIGVQTADIMARIYAVWVNFMIASKRISRPSEIGFLMASASNEVCRLALALGANPLTFNAESIVWNATFISVCTGGPWHSFGRKAGRAVKKGKDPAAVIEKFHHQWVSEGNGLQSMDDLREAVDCCRKLHLKMPVLEEIASVFLVPSEKK